MSNFNYSPVVDGTLADVADINSPFQQVATVLNGGIDSDNITAGSISIDRLASSANPETRQRRNFTNYVVSGLTIGTSATLSAPSASGIAYVNGKEVTASLTPKTYTASKDTYVDLKDDGTFSYVEVANNATSGMTLSTNSDASPALRIARVVTNGTAVVQVLQGSFVSGSSLISPNTTDHFGFDPIGNAIYNLDSRPTLLAYKQVVSNFVTASTTSTQWTNLSVPVIATGRRIKITAYCANVGTTSGSSNPVSLEIWDGTVGSGTRLNFDIKTVINTGYTNYSQMVTAIVTPAAGTKTYNVGVKGTLAANTTWTAATDQPAYIAVEV
jgi:acyl-CoA hydrolase